MPIEYVRGDLFSAKKPVMLLHACNCEGQWGSGIAVEFKRRFPKAHSAYQLHCERYKSELVGTTGLIPVEAEESEEEGIQTIIGCLFTSRAGGRHCDEPARILSNTQQCLVDLKAQLAEPKYKGIALAACQFNSGVFKVPWEQTAQLIEEAGLSVSVYLRHEEGKGESKQV